MIATMILAAAIANIALTIWAVHQALKNQHHLDVFASKLRWTIIFLGISEFFCALHFLGSGLTGMYAAFVGALTAGFFVLFPDAAYYLGKFLLRLKGDPMDR